MTYMCKVGLSDEGKNVNIHTRLSSTMCFGKIHVPSLTPPYFRPPDIVANSTILKYVNRPIAAGIFPSMLLEDMTIEWTCDPSTPTLYQLQTGSEVTQPNSIVHVNNIIYFLKQQMSIKEDQLYVREYSLFYKTIIRQSAPVLQLHFVPDVALNNSSSAFRSCGGTSGP